MNTITMTELINTLKSEIDVQQYRIEGEQQEMKRLAERMQAIGRTAVINVKDMMDGNPYHWNVGEQLASVGQQYNDAEIRMRTAAQAKSSTLRILESVLATCTNQDQHMDAGVSLL